MSRGWQGDSWRVFVVEVVMMVGWVVWSVGVFGCLLVEGEVVEGGQRV